MCIYAWAYICIYVCGYMSAYMCICALCICVLNMHEYTCVYICVYVHMYMCIFVHMSMCVCVCCSSGAFYFVFETGAFSLEFWVRFYPSSAMASLLPVTRLWSNAAILGFLHGFWDMNLCHILRRQELFWLNHLPSSVFNNINPLKNPIGFKAHSIKETHAWSCKPENQEPIHGWGGYWPHGWSYYYYFAKWALYQTPLQICIFTHRSVPLWDIIRAASLYNGYSKHRNTQLVKTQTISAVENSATNGTPLSFPSSQGWESIMKEEACRKIVRGRAGEVCFVNSIDLWTHSSSVTCTRPSPSAS